MGGGGTFAARLPTRRRQYVGAPAGRAVKGTNQWDVGGGGARGGATGADRKAAGKHRSPLCVVVTAPTVAKKCSGACQPAGWAFETVAGGRHAKNTRERGPPMGAATRWKPRVGRPR